MRSSQTLCFVLSMVGIFSLGACAYPPVPKPLDPKVIQWGWGEPDTQFIRRNITQMETMPFQGVIFHVQTAGGESLNWEMWSPRKFSLNDFQHSITNLKETDFQKFTDNFLRVNVTPGTVDWFDEEDWQSVLNNFAVAAQVAKQGGLKGFMFDTEQYVKESEIFNYEDQKYKDEKSFDQYQKKVRARAEEWMRTVNQNFPDITILVTFGYRQARYRSPDSAAGLLGSFLDGMFAACTDETIIVDAWEYSYGYKKKREFVKAYWEIKRKGKRRSKVPIQYEEHGRAGFGLWMDNKWRKYGWNTEDFSSNYFTPEAFQKSVRYTLETTEKYVWIYTEQPRWWPREKLPQPYLDSVKTPQGNGASQQTGK